MKWLLLTLAFLSSLFITPLAAQSPEVRTATGSTLRYDLSVRLLPESRRIETVGTVLLPAISSVREEVTLVLSELLGDFRVEVLKPAAAAGPARVNRLRTNRGQVVWGIRPPRPIAAGEPPLLKFSYAGGEKAAFVFSLGPECSFASGINTPWYPQVEGENDRGTGTLQLSVPPGYTAIATGAQVSNEEEAAKGVFRFAANERSYFAFAAARYKIIRRGGAIPLSVYLLRPRENIEKYVDGCSKILNFLAQLFGPYPYDDFAIVEVPTAQANEADFQGASIKEFILASSAFLDKEFDSGYYAHEIGHQWWGNLVLRTGARGRSMLDEAMTQFGALQAVEALEGEVAAEQFRRRGFGGGAVSYFRMTAAGVDHRLDDMPRELSNQLAYTKGMLALDALSRQVGRERFRLILRRITRLYASRFITWEEFLSEVRSGAGQDLSWFFAQWFERTGAPDWRLTWKQEGGVLHIAITQPPPFYQATIEVQAEGTNYERTVRKLSVRGPTTEFTWPVKFRVRLVVLDPRFQTLRWTPEYRAEAEALAPFEQANKAREEGKLNEAEEMFRVSLQQVTEPDLYGARFLLEYGLARVLFEKGKSDEAKALLEAAVARPTRHAETLPWVYYGFALLAKGAGDEAHLRWAVNATITADAATGGHTGATEEARALLKDR